MKNIIFILIAVGLLVVACSKQEENPFFSEWDTPFGVPPFSEIKEQHYLPAFKEAIKQHQQEIDAIVNNSEAPTFTNTIEALDKSGALLTKVENVFYALNSSNTNSEMQKIAKEVSPLRSKHYDGISMNAKLFERIKAVYNEKNEKGEAYLTLEQTTLLEENYKDFVRSGANLNEEDKGKLKKINEELSALSLKFGENILEENNRFELVIEKKEELAGLPDAVITGAAETAKARGHEGKWAFTLHKPSLIPFLQYSENREYREKMFKGYINRGDHNDSLDTKEILVKMVELRLKKAKLLGYKSHAHFILDRNMAQTPEKVYNLLDKLWEPALKRAKVEVYDMQDMINKEGKKFKLEPWDWWYYAEKVKKVRYDLDEEMLRPYFKLENVREGAFAVANKLWGLTFTELTSIPKYYDEVEVFEVKEADGTHIGILYTDYFPRASKRGGAWMSAFRKQSALDKETAPIIFNVGNLSKPTGDKPALISIDEVTTLFHEFGHGLHGLLSKCKYNRLSGTSVARDFVELPSQIMENWALEPEVLKMYAKHYETGETIPQELIDKIEKAGHFNQGFVTVEYLAASFLDMSWHTITEDKEIDVNKFEKESLDKIGLIPEIVSRYRSTYFRHIFGSPVGYSSGYYSYIWAEVLDADAFQAFKETSLFDKKTATSFRENVLQKGGTEDGMTLYKRFRGAEPDKNALLKKRGLK